MRLPLTVLSVLALAACSGDDESLAVATALDVRIVSGAPSAGEPVARVVVPLFAAPSALGVLGGVVAIGTESGVLVGSLGDATVVPLPVVGDEDEPTSTGVVRSLARRGDDALLVDAAEGLFHSAAGMLLPSPLTTSLAAEIVSIDAFGAGEAEELWICTSAGAEHVAGGELTGFAIPAVATPDAAVGVGPGQAVVTASGSAYLVDLPARAATEIARGIGSVRAFDRGDDGAVHLATEAGLLTRDRNGQVELRTFAADGAPGEDTASVSAAFGALMVENAHGLVSVDADGSTVVGEIASAAARTVAVDANGDVWATDDGALVRFSTGAPVGFAEDARPFFEAHCAKCHAPGADDTVVDHDFTDYDVAKELSAEIVARLGDGGPKTMPPPSAEVLTAADFAVVTRWVYGGLLP